MNVTHHLTWMWTSWSLLLSILVLVITGGLCYLTWRRSEYRRSIGVLELIRFALVLGAVLLLNQPEWSELYSPQEKPTVLILQDGSHSMDTRDVINDSNASGSAMTRREAMQGISQASNWERLKERMEVITQSFNDNPTQGTDLYTPLAEAPDRYRNLQAIVLVSDGDWNEGLPPVQAASSLRLRNIPVITMPLGSRTKLPDIELLSFDVPTFGTANKPIRIP